MDPNQALPNQPFPSPPAPARNRRGLIVGLIVLLVVVVGVAGFFLLRDRAPNDVTSLATGECFDRPADSGSISTIQRQPCNEPHDAEVVVALTHPADASTAYPVVSGFNDFVSENCIPAFESYTGRTFATESELELGYLQPTITSWADGDRGITCFVYRTDEAKMSSSVHAQ